MTYSARPITVEEWDEVSEFAHIAVFGEERPKDLNRHHFIVGLFVDNKLGGYFTCMEMDSETAYIQHGGVFPNFARSIHVVPGYFKMLGLLKEQYKRAWTRIESTNKAMLKMAIHAGFEIVGTYKFKDKLLIELEHNFGG